MNDFYMCINVNQIRMLYIFVHCLFNFLHKFMIPTTSQTNFAHILIFSEYYT